MRHRLRPILILIALLLTAVARPARAQHCWPSRVALLVRDEQGALIHPRELDGYTWTPQAPDSADMAFAVRWLRAGDAAALVSGGAYALVWSGRGDCRVWLDEVSLTRGGRTMRLRLNLRLDTDADPGPAEYVLDAPPFAEGAFEPAAPLPPGATNGVAAVPAGRWRRVPDGG